MIEGFDLAIASMQVGEKSRFTMSGNYGYGLDGFPPYNIGPYATLCYDIELLKID